MLAVNEKGPDFNAQQTNWLIAHSLETSDASKIGVVRFITVIFSLTEILFCYSYR